MHSTGTTSDESTEEDDDADVPLDTAATLGLSKKEWARQHRQVAIEDLSSRQLAVSISGVMGWVLPSDMSELGGEYDACSESAFFGFIMPDLLSFFGWF